MIRPVADSDPTRRPRVLLLLPGGTYRAPDFIAAAESLEVEVVVGADFEQAMAAQMGDRAVLVPLGDPAAGLAAVLELHRRAPIHAVVAVDDQGALVATAAAVALGFPHNPIDAVRVTRDKAAMRERFRAAGLPQPSFAGVPAAAKPDAVAALAAGVGFPVVVKPVSLSASRGVIRADTSVELLAALARSRAIVRAAGQPDTEPLLLEAFVPGREVAIEAILDHGDLHVLAVFDKPDALEGPFFEETIYVTPSCEPTAVQAQIADAVAVACAAVGLVEGPVHAELRIDPDDHHLTVLEIAARTIGGLCGRTLRFGAGISLESLVIAHALGRPFSGRARIGGASGVMMLPIPAAGVLRSVDGQDRARAVPDIEGLEITVTAGRTVEPLPESDRYLGFLFARAATPAAVETALRAAHAELRVTIDPI